MRSLRTVHLLAPHAVWRRLLSGDNRPSLMTAEMVKALDRRSEGRCPYRRLYARAARADEPGIHGRCGARISLGRREFLRGVADLRREAAAFSNTGGGSEYF